MNASSPFDQAKHKTKVKQRAAFDVHTFLDSAGVARKVVEFRKNAVIFAQGDAAEHVMYIQQGGVKLSIVNEAGKEAVVTVLAAGDFFGEGCIAGLPVRMSSATTIMPTTALVIEKDGRSRGLNSEQS